MEDAVAVAQELALLSPAAFAQTKAQIRQAVTERMAASGAATDKAVTEIWAAPETLALYPRLRRAHAQESLTPVVILSAPARDRR